MSHHTAKTPLVWPIASAKQPGRFNMALMQAAGRLLRWSRQFVCAQSYDYRSVVGAMSAELNHIHDMDVLIQHVFKLVRTMRFAYAVLLWREGDELVVRQSMGTHEPLAGLRVSEQSLLIRRLAEHARTIDHGRLMYALGSGKRDRAESALLADPRFQCWLPLVTHGRLNGVIIVGERQGEPWLLDEDHAILDTLAHQVAVAAENVALIVQLRSQLEQVGQMRDELVETQNRLAESREAERLYLAQDLHDGPMQDLYGVRFQLGALDQDLGSDAGRAQLYAALATLQHVIETLRSTCGELRPPTLTPFGLEVAIRSHATRFHDIHADLDLQLDLMHDGQFIPERERLALFRVYQEAVSNIAKHAHARWACIKLELNAEQIVLEIRDDGCGFAVPARWINLARQGHLGLLGMAERITLIAGQLEVLSAEDEGTTIRVILPRQHQPSAAQVGVQ